MLTDRGYIRDVIKREPTGRQRFGISFREARIVLDALDEQARLAAIGAAVESLDLPASDGWAMTKYADGSYGVEVYDDGNRVIGRGDAPTLTGEDDEPTTPTGKRLLRLADDHAEQVLGAEQSEAWVADWWVTHAAIHADILAIEAEARAAIAAALGEDEK